MALAMRMVTINCTDPQRLAAFWTEALGIQIDEDYGGFLFLTSPSEGAVQLGLQRVPEPKAGRNRVHLDLRATDRPAEVRRLLALGAVEIEEQSVPGFAWTVLTDPEGNEFCVGAPQG